MNGILDVYRLKVKVTVITKTVAIHVVTDLMFGPFVVRICTNRFCVWSLTCVPVLESSNGSVIGSLGTYIYVKYKFLKVERTGPCLCLAMGYE